MKKLRQIQLRVNQSAFQEYRIMQLLAAKRMCAKDDGKDVRPCTGSDILRELISEWITEQPIETFENLLIELEKSKIENATTAYIRDIIKFSKNWTKDDNEDFWRDEHGKIVAEE